VLVSTLKRRPTLAVVDGNGGGDSKLLSRAASSLSNEL